LLFISCPSAIGWFVITVVVDSVDAHSGWAVPHILEEVFKFSPPGANGYTSTPVVWIARTVGIGASLNHASPSDIFWGTVFAVSCLQLTSNLISQTTTRPSVPIPEMTLEDYCLVSTSAAAFPIPRK
jgi:hypothetical protein